MPEPKVSELHLRFNEAEESGGFPAEETWDMLVIWKAEDDMGCCCLLSESPVNDDINDVVAAEE